MPHLRRILGQLPLELMFWVAALVYLAAINPDGNGLPTFCVLKALGITFCPGCGLGSSISHALHGEYIISLRHHPLGLFALIVIIHRVFTLTTLLLKSIPHQPMKGYTNA
ncbi:DUF2752 domain-containing protein [Sphingobacteriales bacterium CHB3]|nr:DUF2752 domain-containing protein [Sphingobacteriales bacterium CHB3]